MLTATIAKQFTFHAAHRLPNHDGPCRELHGHSYKLELLVTAPVKSADRSPDEGMVLDFSIVKEIYRENLEPYLEHKYLNESLAQIVDVPFPRTEEGTPLTTCELLATWIAAVFMQKLESEDRGGPFGYQVCVRLWETPTSYAEVGKAWRG